MKMIFIEGGDYTSVVIIILAIMFGPAILLLIIGLSVRKKNKKAAKVFYILAGIYLIVSLGICGGMMI